MRSLIPILLVVAGCYAPDVRDCTVTCSGAADCAGGQVCGPDGFCAASDVAGTCATTYGPDAGNHPDARIDALPAVVLHIQVMGIGKVDITGGGTCSTATGPGDCMITVPIGPVELKAVTLDDSKPFDHWTSMTCMGQPVTCTFNAVVATTVAAKFH